MGWNPAVTVNSITRMKKIGLSELAHFAEIVAAIGVIVSLLYVARQVQSNTAAVKSSTIQAIANASDEALQDSVANANVLRIRNRGDDDPSQLTEEELSAYFTISRGLWIRMQNIYTQHELGVLDERFWFTYSRITCDIYFTRGAQETWSRHSRVLHPDFVDFVESCTSVDSN